jgi:hypothetical protein
MTNDKDQRTNQAQSPNDKREGVWHLSIWILFDIWILEFGI